MSLCGDVLNIQIKKWYVKFGTTGSLKNLKDVDKWSSLSLCLSVRGMSVI